MDAKHLTPEWAAQAAHIWKQILSRNTVNRQTCKTVVAPSPNHLKTHSWTYNYNIKQYILDQQLTQP